MKDTEKMHHINCGKCNGEKTILVRVKPNYGSVEVQVNKCTSCAYQYEIKELFDSMIEVKLKEVTV